jgi:hypothetical protein
MSPLRSPNESVSNGPLRSPNEFVSNGPLRSLLVTDRYGVQMSLLVTDRYGVQMSLTWSPWSSDFRESEGYWLATQCEISDLSLSIRNGEAKRCYLGEVWSLLQAG